ncbi:MAG TPA: glycosyltransferase [Polyangiaceae bacterium]
MAASADLGVRAAPLAPVLSLLVVVYDMPGQARRTLQSLSPAYQENARAEDYEVIVVENASPRLLGREAAESTGPNVRYFPREDTSGTPVGAMNFAASQARGAMLAALVDGARLLSPGIVELGLMAHRAAPGAVLAVPGYHLGSELQQKAVESGYDEAAEARLLEQIAWPSDGYRLFDIACLSGSCAGGFFAPFAESNCLCVPRSHFEQLGGFDPAFVSAGGGYVNLDFYRRVCELPETTLFVAPGEGTFHQFHGGVTTGGVRDAERARLMTDIGAEYRSVRGRPFASPTREPFYLGKIPANARRFVQRSARTWGDLR